MVLLLKPSPKEVQTLIKTDSFQSGIDSVLQEKKIGKLVVSSFLPKSGTFACFLNISWVKRDFCTSFT